MPGPLSKPNPQSVLLLEGDADVHFIQHLCNLAGIARNSFSYVNKGSNSQLLRGLATELRSSEIRQLGIVLDADSDLAATWRAVTDKLRAAGYDAIPAAPAAEGTLLAAHTNAGLAAPTVGIWLMPDNSLPGMLEDLAARMIAPSDELWPLAQQAVGQIAPDRRRFRPTYLRKAEVHTWLAWQDEPGTPLGLAITRTYFDANADLAQRFVGWLRTLFDITP
jgi:hypothetical protein